VKSFYKPILFLVFITFSNTIWGQEQLSKQIKQAYSLTNEGALSLDNKYGDIYINGWDKDSIVIEINIEAKGRNTSKAQALLDRVNPNIIATNKQIIIKSEIVKKQKGLLNKYINKIDPFKSEKANTVIYYKIYLPKYAEVDIHNKYGNLFISNWNGKLKAEIEYGDVNCGEIISNSKINIKQGHLNIETILNSTIIAKNAELSIVLAKALKIDSEGTDINIETIEGLDISSNKDKIIIQTINGVLGTVKYSTMHFRNVESKLNLDLYLAELKIQKLNKIPTLNISQKESEVYVNISETNFAFNATLKQGVLRIPKTMQNIESKMLNKKIKLREITASYGGVKVGNIAFTGVKGVIILKEL
jgi:hypothetical protein